VPEGWARSDLPDTMDFSDKYNALEVRSDAALARRPLADQSMPATLPVLANARLKRSASSSVKPLSCLPVGISSSLYSVNSARNPVTNKAIRLDNARYYFWNGRQTRDADIVSACWR
jgi:hypothetical protein